MTPTDRARARFEAGDLGGAIELAACAETPVLAALRAVGAGEWAAGLASAEAALGLSPADRLALWCRAEAKVGLGDRAGALADWSRLLELDPAARCARKDRAVLRALLCDRPGALADLAVAAARSPDDVVPHLWTAGLGGSPDGLASFPHRDGWSARLGALVLGAASADDLLADAGGSRPRICQAHGYAGLVAERDGDGARALAHYARSAATAQWHYLTHLWSRTRLADAPRS